MPDVVTARPSDAEALAAEAASMGAALADLVDALGDSHAELLGDAAVFLRRMAATHPPPPPGDVVARPLERLVGALGLGELERSAVVLAGLPEQHEGYASVLRRLSPDGEPRPTTGLAAQLLCEGVDERHALVRALAHGGAVAAGLLRVRGDGPWPERSLELSDGIWAELAGPEPASAGATTVAVAAGLEDWFASEPVARAIRAVAADERVTVLVVSDNASSAAARALALVARAGRAWLDGAPPAGDRVATARLELHALARGAVPVVALARCRPGEDPAPVVSRHPGALVLSGRPGDAIAGGGARTLMMVRAEPLGTVARRRMWAEVLPELADLSGELASRHVVEPAVAAMVATDVRSRAWLDERAPTRADVAASTSARSAGALPAGVTLRRPVAGWDDLVLPADRLSQLHDAVDRLRHQALVLDDWGFLRGRAGARGVRILLAGPPGTGKTLSAEVLATALHVDLMVVDISRILSKWIGETEQHLAEVFDAAEPAQTILLFDEADALFGKRTEITDAHDRYANLETAYLLQRLERFEGLAILTTNLRQNIDEAFTRRIEFVIEYDEPGEHEREALWMAHLPAGAPVAGDLDLAELAARYPVTGGLIRNASVAAAFLAAADGTAITREHALNALEREYEKHGRAFPGRPPQSRRTNLDVSAARGTA